MSNENGFNPAYPYHIKLQNSDSEKPFAEYVSHGLTKREYFAGLAMQGIRAAEPWKIKPFNRLKKFLGLNTSFSVADNKDVARIAVMQADALLAELSSNKESGE